MTFKSIFIFLAVSSFLVSCSTTNSKHFPRLSEREFIGGAGTDRR